MFAVVPSTYKWYYIVKHTYYYHILRIEGEDSIMKKNYVVKIILWVIGIVLLIPGIQNGYTSGTVFGVLIILIGFIVKPIIKNSNLSKIQQSQNPQISPLKEPVASYVPQSQPSAIVTEPKGIRNHDEYQIHTKKSRNALNNFVAVDIETTGLSSYNDNIIEIAAIRFCEGKVVDRYVKLINPKCRIPAAASKVNHITDAMVCNCPTIDMIFPEFLNYVGESVLVFHNASFDLQFLDATARKMEVDFVNQHIDTLKHARRIYFELPNHKLTTLVDTLGINTGGNMHRGGTDAECAGRLLLKCIEAYEQRDAEKLAIRKAKAAEKKASSI